MKPTLCLFLALLSVPAWGIGPIAQTWDYKFYAADEHGALFTLQIHMTCIYSDAGVESQVLIEQLDPFGVTVDHFGEKVRVASVSG